MKLLLTNKYNRKINNNKINMKLLLPDRYNRKIKRKYEIVTR